MCESFFVPLLADDLLRLFTSFILLICCIILSYIFAKKKPWDVIFWLCFAMFLFSLASYGHVMHHIYLANTFSYDGFISGASFITICGLLFSRRRYMAFSNSFFNKKTPLLIATFLIFTFIYLLTLKFKNNCYVSLYDLFVNILQVEIYPLLLLLGISMFLYRFSMCLSVFAVSMALFLVQNLTFIASAFVENSEYQVFVEEIICATLSAICSAVAIYVLIKAKRIYKESLDD